MIRFDGEELFAKLLGFSKPLGAVRDDGLQQKVVAKFVRPTASTVYGFCLGRSLIRTVHVTQMTQQA
jgi:hypothetical protein